MASFMHGMNIAILVLYACTNRGSLSLDAWVASSQAMQFSSVCSHQSCLPPSQVNLIIGMDGQTQGMETSVSLGVLELELSCSKLGTFQDNHPKEPGAMLTVRRSIGPGPAPTR